MTRSTAPPRRPRRRTGVGSYSSSSSPSRSNLEMLSTPQHALQAHQPLNPFDDVAGNQQHASHQQFFARRPGSSPQPNTSTYPNEFLRRPSITVDTAILKATTTTATAGPGLLSSQQYAVKNKQPEPPPQWLSALASRHPVRLMNCIRLTVVVPLLIYLLATALKGADWLHNEISVDSAGSSRTLLSLTGVERVMKTGLDKPEAAAMLSELSIGYGSVIHSAACDTETHLEKASTVLGGSAPLDVARVNSDRDYRLAVFGILYGPTFRDVDCRALAKFRTIGILSSIFLTLALVCLFAEWILLLCHLVSRRLMTNAIAAHDFCLLAPGHPNSCDHPPFLMPSDDWIPIDMYTTSSADDSNRIARGEPGDYANGTMRFPNRAGEPGPNSDGAAPGGRNESIELPLFLTTNEVAWIDKMWWRPLRAVVKKFAIQIRPTDANRPPSGAQLLKYPLISFLEGPSLFLSTSAVLVGGLGLSLWSNQTSLPACLSADTELESCQPGGSYKLAVMTLWLAALNAVSHLFSGQLCLKLAKLTPSMDSTVVTGSQRADPLCREEPPTNRKI